MNSTGWDGYRDWTGVVGSSAEKTEEESSEELGKLI